MASCPHCDKPLTELTINPMKGTVPIGLQWNCMLFSCPSCQKAIGAAVDGSSGRAEIMARIDQLVDKLAAKAG